MAPAHSRKEPRLDDCPWQLPEPRTRWRRAPRRLTRPRLGPSRLHLLRACTLVSPQTLREGDPTSWHRRESNGALSRLGQGRRAEHGMVLAALTPVPSSFSTVPHARAPTVTEELHNDVRFASLVVEKAPR